MEKIKCPNCGAAIYENEPKCPFCGYINITGAEEKFMRDVQKTEENLSQIPDIQKKHLKKSISKNSKIIFITIGIVAVVFLILFGLNRLFEYVLYSYDEPDPKAQMQWENETFPMLDEWYAEGKYDEILTFEQELYKKNEKDSKVNHSLLNWEHYDFIEAYGNYIIFTSQIEVMNQGTEVSNYMAEDLVYFGLWFYYRAYDRSIYEITPEEMRKSEGYRETVVKDLFDRLKFTQEELDTIEDEFMEDGFLNLSECLKYSKKIKDRFE